MNKNKIMGVIGFVAFLILYSLFIYKSNKLDSSNFEWLKDRCIAGIIAIVAFGIALIVNIHDYRKSKSNNLSFIIISIIWICICIARIYLDCNTYNMSAALKHLH